MGADEIASPAPAQDKNPVALSAAVYRPGVGVKLVIGCGHRSTFFGGHGQQPLNPDPASTGLMITGG